MYEYNYICLLIIQSFILPWRLHRKRIEAVLSINISSSLQQVNTLLLRPFRPFIQLTVLSTYKVPGLKLGEMNLLLFLIPLRYQPP